MRIAIIKQNENNSLAYAGYLYDLLLSAAKDHRYEMVDTANKIKDLPSSDNVLFIVHNSASTQLGLRWFYEVHLPSQLRRLNVGIVIHLAGALSTTVKLAQLLVLPGLDALQNPSEKKSVSVQYFNKKLAAVLSKASGFITYATSVKKDVEEKGVQADKVTIVPVAAEEFFKPIEWEQKELLKAEHTGGSEFFLVNKNFTNQDELLQLLKAFSVFKKWQQSSMKLIISGELLFEDAQEKIATYKYRNDVKIISPLPAQQYAILLASCYCFMHLSDDETNLLPLAQAMQSGTAVITKSFGSYKAFCRENVLYNEDGDSQTIGNNLIRIYKNEQLRNLLIKGSIEITVSNQYQIIKSNLWELIEERGK